MWPLPLQPLDAADEEDFPRLKRLIRTLRLMRDMDEKAAVRGSVREPTETSLEANMREACRIYIEGRLVDQENYYSEHAPRHTAVEKFWPATVSPGSGRRSVVAMRSMLMEPKTMIMRFGP